MKVNDRDLVSVINNMNDIFRGYGKGWVQLDLAKEQLFKEQSELNNKIAYQERRLKEMTSLSETDRGNSIALATSKDIGLVKQSITDAINRGSYSFAISLGNLITSSTIHPDSDKFQVKRLVFDAKEKSGYSKEQDIFNQCKVVKVELDAMLDLIGSDGFKEVSSAVNMKRAPAEIGYVRNKEKAERLMD